MSALPPKADIAERECHVRFVPKADIASHPRANDGAGDAAADRLTEQLTDIDTTGSLLEHRQQRSEKRAATRATDRASNRVTERAEADILDSSAHCLAADGSGDELDDQIDKRR